MNNTDIDSFADEVIADFRATITDEIFLRIQSNREFMQQYLSLVAQHGAPHINRVIGKRVKNQFSLTNADERNELPRSTLIKSHQSFI